MTSGSVPDITGAVHTKLCLAISDLAQSANVAVNQIRFRARRSMVIGNAEQVELVAELLHCAALDDLNKESEQQPTLVPNVLNSTEWSQRSTVPSRVQPFQAIDDLQAACDWLIAEQNPNVEIRSENSAIAMRILDLYDRMGGLIK
jgi:hypothetical protein